MYVRLAFAVAAHLNPDILIVDEVLAVGDAAFQAKCLGRMQEVARNEGRTVLFVSHNMAAVNSLCTRGLFMEAGRVALDGSVEDVVAHYNARMPAATGERMDLSDAPRKGGRDVRFESVRVTPLDEATGEVIPAGRAGCDWRIEATLRSNVALSGAIFDAFVFDPNGYRLIDMSTSKHGQRHELRAGEVVRATYLMRNALLKPGTYTLGLWVGTQAETMDLIEPATSFTVLTYTEGQRHEHYPGPYIPHFDVRVASDATPEPRPAPHALAEVGEA
jgi:lipopolysaccharide transport system ATP-binding protein